MAEQVFISYRREEGDVTAKLICEALKNRGYSVFCDCDFIRSELLNWRIYNTIENCNDFIIILTPHALDKCTYENDQVRLEISHALRYRKNIIPVMLSGFAFPSFMISEISELSRYNGVEFIMSYFDSVIAKISKRMTSSTGTHFTPTPAPPPTPVFRFDSSPSSGLDYQMFYDEPGYTVRRGKCKDSNVVIPSSYNGKSVVSIGSWAFEGWSSIRSVSIPSSVTKIEELAFNDCINLSQIYMSENLKSIGAGSFLGCKSLQQITLPKTLTSIDSWAFDRCESLRSIKYTGTVRQWKNIDLGLGWTPAHLRIINCADGNVTV